MMALVWECEDEEEASARVGVADAEEDVRVGTAVDSDELVELVIEDAAAAKQSQNI